MISAIIVSFDYNDSDVESLQSSVNDVSLISTLLEKEAIEYKIIGSLNLQGKLVHWKRKMNNEIFIEEGSELVLYVTGHGSRDGFILWGDSTNKKSIQDIIGTYKVFKLYIILDICYAHKILERFLQETSIKEENIFYIISTSSKCPVALSSPRGSIFTMRLFDQAFKGDKRLVDFFTTFGTNKGSSFLSM